MKRTHLFMWLLMPLFVFAQQLPNIVPPSPEAANAFKFSEIPVSLYTGLPNISIPLFEIESGGVKVPISISYHARGIQVAEVTSRVGAGWTLNCGGMITKQARDLDNGSNPFVCADYIPDLPGESSTQNIYNSSVSRWNIFYDYANPQRNCDINPDVYSYSVNGMSGKFLPDPYTTIATPETFHSQQFDNLKFLSTNEIRDDRGNRYLFQDFKKPEYSENVGDTDYTADTFSITPTNILNGTHALSSPNTWHLLKIVTATQDTIRFSYETEHSRYKRRTNDLNVAPNNISNVSEISSVQQRLSQITFNDGRVDFEYYPEQRQDLAFSYALHKITLYNKSNEIIKQAIFDYFYSTGPSDSNTNPFFNTDTLARKRLFLSSVRFMASDSITTPSYQFTYNPTPLPSRHSNAIDLWGYYNGKSNGWFLEPLLDDRSVDPELAQAGMLTRITKPEGGTIDFTYEPNIAVNVFPESVVIENTNPKVYKDILLSPITIGLTSASNVPVNGYYSNAFTVTEFQNGFIKYNLWGSGVSNCPCGSVQGCQQTGTNCKFKITVVKLDPETNTYGNAELLYQGNQRILFLEPGTYKIRAELIGSVNGYHYTNEDFFNAYIYWFEEISSHAPLELQCSNMNENYSGTKVIYAAGNRIKKIEYRDAPDGPVALTKTYTYEDASGVTSGRLLGLSAFVGVKTAAELNGSPAPVSWSLGSGGASLFTTYQSNNVGYKYVTEYLGDETGNIGKTEYEYSIVYDSGRYYEFPFHAPTDNEWLRGKELSVKHYKNAGNGYQLVKSIGNTYSLAEQFNLSSSNQALCSHPFLKPSVYHDIDTDFPGGGMELNRRYWTFPLFVLTGNLNVGLSYKTYYMTGGTLDLSKTVTTDYFDDGTEINNTVEYRYDYDNHYSVAEEQRTTSTGASVLTKYFYPQDPEMAAKPTRQALLTKNMVGSPLVTQSFKGIEKLSELETVYKVFGADILAPEIIKTAKGNDVLEERLRYNKIDAANGNVLEVQQANGIPISYIWGHNGQYPIAKIENATFQEILTALSTTEAALKSLTVAPANIRQLLPNAMVTTLTYKPLVGVTSITDPKGLATTYEYDSLGRLLRVKDHEGKILSENQYNFKNN